MQLRGVGEFDASRFPAVVCGSGNREFDLAMGRGADWWNSVLPFRAFTNLSDPDATYAPWVLVTPTTDRILASAVPLIRDGRVLSGVIRYNMARIEQRLHRDFWPSRHPMAMTRLAAHELAHAVLALRHSDSNNDSNVMHEHWSDLALSLSERQADYLTGERDD